MPDIVNTGTAADTGTGDELRTAFTRINERFQQLLGTLSQITWAPGLAIQATPAREWTVVGGQAYVAASNHIAGATFAADLAAGRWLAADVAQLIFDLASTGAGKGGDLVASNDGAGGSLWTTVAGFIEHVQSADGASAVGFRQAGTGAVPRTMLDKAQESVSVKDFGAVGDGVADDTVALQLFYDYLKVNGGVGLLNSGCTYNVTARIYTTGGTKPFVVLGYGATIKRASNFSATVVEVNSTHGVVHIGLEIDCQHQTFASGNHGLVYSDCNDALAVGVTVKNHRNTAIMMFSTTPGVFKNNVMRNCRAIGNSGATANNGLLIAELDYSGIENCYAENILGAPGYGLQLKNQCRWCWITGGGVKNAVFAMGWGNDSGLSGVVDSYCELSFAEGCDAALDAGRADRNSFRVGVFKGSATTSRNVINLSECDGNSVHIGTFQDGATSQVLARLRTGCENNAVRCDVIRRGVGAAAGCAATFDAGVTGNRVSVGVIYGATTPYTSTLATNNSGNSTNVLEYDQAPSTQLVSIASDAFTVASGKIVGVTVDTEGGAATDDLATISGGVEGQVIRIRTAANTRDVTVKHGTGNIVLNGLADFIMDASNDCLTLAWNSSTSRWTECGRGNNA